MATSKTLTPTNVTIQIPAFTDKPDQRLNSNCIDKEADAINALSDQIAKQTSQKAGQITAGATVTQSFTSYAIVAVSRTSYGRALYVVDTTGIQEIVNDTNNIPVTVSGSTITITNNKSVTMNYMIMYA